MTLAQEQMLDGHYREILARIEGLSGRIDETREDAREARDAATKLTERVGAQDIPAKLAELKGQVEKGFADARSDLVNSSDKITREMRTGHEDHGKRISALEQFRDGVDFKGHATRIEALEAVRNRTDGANGVLKWMSANMPWLAPTVFVAAIVMAAVLGVKVKWP